MKKNFYEALLIKDLGKMQRIIFPVNIFELNFLAKGIS